LHINGTDNFQRRKFKYVKKFSTSLVLKEMQIKTTLRFHLTPVRMTINNTNNKNDANVRKKKPINIVDKKVN
jgi:hypothetical protein